LFISVFPFHDPKTMQQQEPNPPIQDRIERLRRALSLFLSEQTVIQTFLQVEHEQRLLVSGKENELRTHMQHTPSVIPTQLQLELTALKTELDAVYEKRRNVVEMIYRTIRDTYNADAAELARIQ
jgi:hypothetical protein